MSNQTKEDLLNKSLSKTDVCLSSSVWDQDY